MGTKIKVDVLVVGELNVDLILDRIDGFPVVGAEKLADRMSLTLGSSSAIFASNLSSLGSKVSFVAKAGKDIFGCFCRDRLTEKGVDTSMLIQEPGLATGATVVLNFREDRAMITHPGAMQHLGIGDIDRDMLRTAKHLHFSSYYLQPGFRDQLDRLFRMAKQEGLTTSLDMQWDPAERWDLDFRKVLPFVDIFFPNELELLKLTGEDSLDRSIEEVRKYGKYILVKRGSEGSLLSYDRKTVRKPAFLHQRFVDAIGAGDSFNAGYIYKFLGGHSPEECQVFGNLIGAISTTSPGGTGAFGSYEETIKIAKDIFGYEE